MKRKKRYIHSDNVTDDIADEIMDVIDIKPLLVSRCGTPALQMEREKERRKEEKEKGGNGDEYYFPLRSPAEKARTTLLTYDAASLAGI